MSSYTRLTRQQLAQRIAQDIDDGLYVNLGIGMPTLIGRCLPPGRDILLHSENGIVGMGPSPAPGEEDASLVNAGREYITLLPGAAITDHTTSFAIMRGGHLDLTVLGGFQVSERGDLANWDTGEPGSLPAVGGAMDLAVGARRVWVMMEHVTKDGTAKIVRECSYPLTGARVVDRIYTDLAVIDVTADGLQLRSMIDGLTFAELQALTAAPLRRAA